MSSADRKSQTTTFTYDALDRRVRAEYADGAIATFTYDAAGRLLEADDTADPHRPIVMAYDPLDRLLAETTSLGTVGYQYDALGRRTQMTVGGQAPVSYAYDANSRLRTIAQAPLNPVDIQYDALGRRTLLTLPNQVSTEYQYDAASQLIAQTYTGPAGLLGDLTYSYDATGSRIGTGGSWARSGIPETVTSSAYDAVNQQLAFGTLNQTFDPNGNLLTQTDASGTTTYSWDARNRLVAMNGPNVTASFSYDALGRRLAKIINGLTTSFHYDGLDIVREVGAAGETSYLRTFAIDETLARTAATGTSAYLPDLLGSTLALTDGTGAVQATYSYDPFGMTGITGPPGNPLQYTGRENDGTGLYYYRARYYAPLLQRFLSEDPITVRFPWNKYAYVLNSPLGFTDPFGLEPLSYANIKKLVAENNRSGVPDEIIIAQAWKESSFDPDATNPGSTARGLLQVTKPAAQDVGANHDELFDPTLNIQAGTDYLRNRLDLVRRRRQDLTDEEARIRRGLELYKSGDARGMGYGDDILAAAKCLGGRKGNPKRCLEKIHK